MTEQRGKLLFEVQIDADRYTNRVIARPEGPS